MSIMQEQPSAYTAYARKLCPSWCTEPHSEPTDPNDLSAVRHEGPVGDAGERHRSANDVRVNRWDSLTDENDPACVFLDTVEYSPEEATALGVLLIRAAELARRG